ncbi:hypothetical protein PMIN02_011160 [Paraphaeosphaeria minitans]
MSQELNIITTHQLIYSTTKHRSKHSTFLPPTIVKMQFFTVIAFAFAAAAAAPALESRQIPVCTGGSPLCCATDVLNLADLDCATRKLPRKLHNISSLANISQLPPPPPAPTSSSTSAPPLASRPSAASCPSSARLSSAPTSTPLPTPPSSLLPLLKRVATMR